MKEPRPPFRVIGGGDRYLSTGDVILRRFVIVYYVERIR